MLCMLPYSCFFIQNVIMLLFVVAVVVVVIVHMYMLPVHFLPFISYFVYTLKAKTKE